jgi:Domain of unknown function (DUF5916)/Carbohydrate family 9 binding domain-like
MNKICNTILLLIAGSFIGSVQAQVSKTFQAVKTTGIIRVDGQLTEDNWKQAAAIGSFERNFPDDTSAAVYPTDVKLMYDDNNLYVAAVLHRNTGKKYSVSSLKKDFLFYDNDAFGIIIDPFNDRINGYGFYVNAYGARRDEQIANGTIVDATMDTKWTAEVVRTGDHWQVEIVIPFKYIRHKENTSWNINFVRNDRGANERTSWVRTPINFLLPNLAFSGQLVWEAGITQDKKALSLIPGITTAVKKEAGVKADYILQPSLDAKIALSSSVNMDVTINPDFSQAEADVVQLNLSRFELVFPENRLFFVENSDLFAGYGDATWGNPVVRPFYSRKIGLRYDSTIGGYVPTKILGGARISGKLNNNLRFGGMSLFTQRERFEGPGGETHYIPSQNYSVLALQQKVFGRSSVSAMLVNRQAFGSDSNSKVSLNVNDYNRVLALEYSFASPNDKFSGKVYQHTEFNKNRGRQEYARGFLFYHNTSVWRNWIQITQISPNFQPDAGLIPRNNILDVNLQGSYSIYLKKGSVNQWEFTANPQFYLTASGHYSDHFLTGGIHPIWRNTAEMWIAPIQERVTLKAPFDPTFKNRVKLDSGIVNTYTYLRLYYGSDRRQSFYWQVLLDIGEYYSGQQVRSEGFFNYRIQPHTTVGINYTFGYFSLPKPFTSNCVYYLGPKADISFTRNIFLTSMVQYSSLSHNLNFYTRFQWRFMPLSDLYIIYSANRDTQYGQFRDQGLVIKAMLWL